MQSHYLGSYTLASGPWQFHGDSLKIAAAVVLILVLKWTANKLLQLYLCCKEYVKPLEWDN